MTGGSTIFSALWTEPESTETTDKAGVVPDKAGVVPDKAGVVPG